MPKLRHRGRHGLGKPTPKKKKAPPKKKPKVDPAPPDHEVTGSESSTEPHYVDKILDKRVRDGKLEYYVKWLDIPKW